MSPSRTWRLFSTKKRLPHCEQSLAQRIIYKSQYTIDMGLRDNTAQKPFINQLAQQQAYPFASRKNVKLNDDIFRFFDSGTKRQITPTYLSNSTLSSKRTLYVYLKVNWNFLDRYVFPQLVSIRTSIFGKYVRQAGDMALSVSEYDPTRQIVSKK